MVREGIHRRGDIEAIHSNISGHGIGHIGEKEDRD